MGFSIDGCFSNGQGLIGFYGFDLWKMKTLLKNPNSFLIMNLLIIRLLEVSYFSNQIYKTIYFSFSHLKTSMPKLDISENDLKKIFSELSKVKLIKTKKVKNEASWIIDFIF